MHRITIKEFHDSWRVVIKSMLKRYDKKNLFKYNGQFDNQYREKTQVPINLSVISLLCYKVVISKQLAIEHSLY